MFMPSVLIKIVPLMSKKCKKVFNLVCHNCLSIGVKI